MHELRDDYCPFCRTVGTVQFYENATSLYGKLYKCRFCTAVFDARQKEQEERVQKREIQEKLRIKKENEEMHVHMVPKKKGLSLMKFVSLSIIFAIIVIVIL